MRIRDHVDESQSLYRVFFAHNLTLLRQKLEKKNKHCRTLEGILFIQFNNLGIQLIIWLVHIKEWGEVRITILARCAVFFTRMRMWVYTQGLRKSFFKNDPSTSSTTQGSQQ